MPSLNGLEKLRDLHLPKPIGWFPLALGWEILMVIGLLLLVCLGYLSYRRFYRGKAKRQALKLLNDYKHHYLHQADTVWVSSQLSQLLKRVALAYFPRQQVASLQGKSWLEFLNKTSRGLDFYKVENSLLQLPFQPPNQAHNLDLLFKTVENWIKQRGEKHV